MEIRLPELSGARDDIIITAWHVKETDHVDEGEDILEVVTDKATFDVPSPCCGKVLRILKKEGDRTSAGDAVAEIEEDPA